MSLRPSSELVLPPEPVGRRSVRALAAAQAAAVATGFLWYGLSIATGLIFHFMPGAPFLAATFVFRQSAGNRRATWPETAVILTGGLLVVAAGLVAIAAGGRALDAPQAVAAIIAAGAVIALLWLRRAGQPVAGT